MDEDTVADLKQFLATAIKIAVQEAFDKQLDEKLEKKLAESERRLELKLGKRIDDKGDEILDAIATTMQNHIEYTDERFNNHDKRLRKLEHKPAV